MIGAQGLADFVHIVGDVCAVQQAAHRAHGLDTQVGRRFAGGYFLGGVDVPVDALQQRALLAGFATGEIRLGVTDPPLTGVGNGRNRACA